MFILSPHSQCLDALDFGVSFVITIGLKVAVCVLILRLLKTENDSFIYKGRHSLSCSRQT